MFGKKMGTMELEVILDNINSSSFCTDAKYKCFWAHDWSS